MVTRDSAGPSAAQGDLTGDGAEEFSGATVGFTFSEFCLAASLLMAYTGIRYGALERDEQGRWIPRRRFCQILYVLD